MYEWQQVVNLMGKVSKEISSTLSCNSTICTLPNSCSSPSYKTFLDYVLMVQFGSNTNYVSVTLYSLVATDPINGFCNIYISQKQSVIFGSMWLQNFLAYFLDSQLSL